MIKRVLLTTVIAIVVVGAIFGFRQRQLKQAAAAAALQKPAPATVSTAPAVAQNWRSQLSAVGTVESYQGVVMRSEIEGRIVKIAFESGGVVKEGDVLVELEASNEQAQLQAAEAAVKLTAASLQRAKELRANNTNSAAELDSADAAYAQAIAGAENLRATLAKKRIVAPFSGRLGIRQVNIGQFLNKGDAIVSIEAMNPAYVDFALPQQELTQLKPGLPVQVTVDAFPDRKFTGKIEAIDPRVSDASRNVRVRAVVPNPDEILRPGLFAQVTVELPAETAVLELPATAIVYSPYGNSVYVVVEKAGADGAKQLVVDQRFITTGAQRGDQVAVLKGIEAGEQVVTSGQMKLRNGAAVTVNNTVVPANNPNPKPSES